MGMQASGHVADATFFHHAEEDFVLVPSIRELYGLFFYARYKDDIFLIFDTPDDDISRVHRFIIDFKAKCVPFVISLDGVSRRGCQMLDMFVSVDCDRFPVFSLFTKPSSIWQPLGIESCHHPSIHMHWPINQCMRIGERYSHSVLGSEAVHSFRKAYRAATGVEICSVTQPKSERCSSTSWVVVPFDFVMGNARIQQAINLVKLPLGALGSFKRVMVSWALGNKHLMHKLRTA